MAIADVLRALGFTSETEPLAAKVYAEAGEANLVFTAGYIQSVIGVLRAEHGKFGESELKRIVSRATFISNFAANLAALIEDGVPVADIRKVFDDVGLWIEQEKIKARKLN